MNKDLRRKIDRKSPHFFRVAEVGLADNPFVGDQYVFTALDTDTKLMPTFTIGKRNRQNCEYFMLDLAARMAPGRPGGEPRHLQISSDAFAAYPGAVDLAFADQVLYGQIIKSFHVTEVDQPGRYGPPEMSGTIRTPIIGEVDPWSICTSHVERQNLTMRTFLRRLMR